MKNFANLLKMKSIVTILLVASLIALVFIRGDEATTIALTTAVSIAIGSLFAKKNSTETE